MIKKGTALYGAKSDTKFDFMESAAKAGYPYTMVSTAKLEGRIDAVVYTSYKTMKDAYKDAAYRVQELAELYDDEKSFVWFGASISRTDIRNGYPLFKHICVVGRYSFAKSGLCLASDGKTQYVRQPVWR